MARTNKKSSYSVTLFPFLSILACVMGTLTLIIYGVAIAQTPPGESYDPNEIKQLKDNITRALERDKQISDLTVKNARLRLIKQVRELEEQLAQSGFQLDHLKDQIKTAQEELNTMVLATPAESEPG